MAAYFGKEFWAFHNGLKKNNDREWFNAHKDAYEKQVRQPALQLIGDLAKDFAKISKAVKVDAAPSGGSLFRIYRDVRFSKDKSPYKTHTGIHFPHVSSGKDMSVAAPGYYLHLEPGASFVCGGIWRPSSAALAKVRAAIVKDPAAWKRATKGLDFDEESFKRVPKDVDAEHPLITDLMRKDFIATTKLSDADVTSKTFKADLVKACKEKAALAAFLAKALKVAW